MSKLTRWCDMKAFNNLSLDSSLCLNFTTIIAYISEHWFLEVMNASEKFNMGDPTWSGYYFKSQLLFLTLDFFGIRLMTSPTHNSAHWKLPSLLTKIMALDWILT